jgi:hypothetical protein
MRLTVPYTMSGPGLQGLGDVQVFDLVILPQKWGRLGVGAVFNFGVDRGNDTDTFQLGPAIGGVAHKGQTNYGLFLQSAFSSDVQFTVLQPIYAVNLTNTVSVSLGNTAWTYDLKHGRTVSFPIGPSLGYLTTVARQRVKFTFGPLYNPFGTPGTPQWDLQFGIALIAVSG